MIPSEQHRLECEARYWVAQAHKQHKAWRYWLKQKLERIEEVRKDSQRVPRPPRVQYFSNGMVLIERDNETPEFISLELFNNQYAKAGIN